MVFFPQDGYILCVLGPFLSDYKNNDASILKHCVNNNEQDILNWLDEDDVLILDRGFRDAIRAMNKFGFEVAMPHFLNGRKQFSFEEANRNRCITKVRWVIESGKVHVREKFTRKYFIQ
jgi:lipopolysaccharide biosynthesis glycosyltransferase